MAGAGLARWTVFWGVAAVVLATLVVRWIPTKGPGRDEVGRWLRPLLLAIAGIVVGYLMIVPVGDRYTLYVPGVLNRTNCFAALGFSALVVFLAAALASMLAAAVPRLSKANRSWLSATVAGLLIFAMIGVYAVRITESGDRWARSAELQAEVLAGAHALVPSPPSDSTIFTSPYPGYSSPNIPVFGGGGNNDQLGAFKVSYGSEELRSFPLLEGLGLICGPENMATPDADNSETEYGKAILIDFRTEAVYRPMNRKECIEDTAAMEPFGVANLTHEW